MVMTARAAATSALSPEYLAEDDSAPLYHLSIVFAILQTIFFVLFYISRYLNNNINGADVWFLIPIAYLACMMHSIDGICK
jgi:predicted membrane protein